MDMDEDEVIWDGPNIRPPQMSQDSRGHRSRGGGDRRDHGHHRSGSGSYHRRQDRPSSRSHSSRDKPRDYRDRNRDQHRSSDDLRGRLSSSKNEKKPSSREREREKHRSRQHGSNASSETEQRIRKVLTAKSDKDSSRRDAELRRQRREVERQLKEEEEQRIRRKRDHSKSAEAHSKHRKLSETEKQDSPPDGSADEEDKQENESDENEGSEASSSSGESESGEVESSSSESEDNTGSERSEETPEHDEEDEDEDDDEVEPVEQAVKEVEKMQAEKEKREKGIHRKESTASEGERSPSRTPSRSPTPRREPIDVDYHEERKKVKAPSQEGSPGSRSSFADNMAGDERNEQEANSADQEEKEDEKLPPYLPSVYGCRSVEEFQCLNRIEEGTYGVVYRAKDKKTNQIVALKRLKMEREKEGFPITSLREINTLLISQHPNVVTVREIVVGSNMDKIYIVMDFVEHDLKSLMETMRHKKQVFIPGEVKCLMLQLLHAIAYLHDNWILHRDLKTSNLLLSHNGILKVGDFGLAREYGSPLKPYTSVVVTLWYRAPELLLAIKEYSTHIDVWSLGCIFAELLLMEPLFTGKSDLEQLTLIFKLLGTPSEKIWTGFSKLPVVQKSSLPEYPATNLKAKFPPHMLSEAGLNLLKRFFTYDPKKRITCEDAISADYFKESPRAIDPSMFPTWPAKSEGAHQSKKGASPKPPSGGGAFKKINEDEDKYTGFVLNPGKAAPLPWNLKF